MSTLAKTMALSCGVGLDEPYIFEHFFPLDWSLDKAIFLHAGGGQRNERNEPMFPAKIYDHFNEVVRLLSPIIEKAGYRIFQIGAPNETPIDGTFNLCGFTNMKQTAFLLKRSALFFGNDSVNAHMAGSFKIPMVVLYGPTDAKNHGPEWFNPDKTILLESHRFGEKRPSYSSGEPEKTINVIKPETVVNSILKLLSLEEISRNSYYMGPHFTNQMLEITPDNILRPDFFPQMGINVRMDYLWSEQGLLANLQQRKCGIFSDKPFNMEILKQNRGNVNFCRIKITNDITPEFARQIVRFGAPYSFYTEERDPVKLKQLRYDFFDVTMVEQTKDFSVQSFWDGSKRYLNSELDKNLNFDNVTYKSNKYIISKSGIYISYAAYLKGLKVENLSTNFQKIGDLAKDVDFWNEIEHYYIYQ